MSALTFAEARACVLERVRGHLPALAVESVRLLDSVGRVLAEPVKADRDYPPMARSARDGFAMKAGQLGPLEIIGEVRAGQTFAGVVREGQAVEIMTGAPLPEGADSVVMIEDVVVTEGVMSPVRIPSRGDNFNPQGCEALAGSVMLKPGARIGFAEIALMASVGMQQVSVYRRPRVAIVATGDELVALHQTPRPDQIRNSNSYSLAAQVQRAGGEADVLWTAPDEYTETRDRIEEALQSDLLLLSGGVSAGKYDLVEKVLGEIGAEFHFTRVRIQPGQPLVFGRTHGKFFFGLPGNPLSTMVTFEIFARAAVELLSGQKEPMLPLLTARLEESFYPKPGLTRFLPARLSPDGATIRPMPWKGSGDMAALARANCFLVTDPERDEYPMGEPIRVLMK